MKRLSALLCFVALSIFFLSCSKEDEAPDSIVAGDYVLVEVLPPTGIVMTEEEIPHNETYTFRRDGTFVKSISGSSMDGQATGTFTTEEAEPNQRGMEYYLVLTFETGPEFATSCAPGEGVESFILYEDGSIVNASGACDLVTLTYKKTN